MECDSLWRLVLLPFVAALVALTPALQANDLSLPITGSLTGSVLDAVGTPQMGASVQILNRYNRVVSNTITAADGSFGFVGLQADFYSIRVSLASFLPASRDKIPVKAGLDSVLQIHLATLFSNVELSYTVPAAAMSDDWRWVLRSSPATRPINRALNVGFPGSSSSDADRVPLFSETHARLMVSGGDSGLLNSDFGAGDLGTGFALSTNFLGKNLLQLGGSMDQTANVGPSAIGLFAVYSRNETGNSGAPPEIVFSFAQLGGIGPQLLGNQALPSANAFTTSPVVRMMSLSTYDTLDVASELHLEYGVIAESVDYLQHKGRLTPFGRLSADLGSGLEIIASYSNGGRPDPLLSHQSSTAPADGQNNDRSSPTSSITPLSRLPQLSDENGRLQLQRTQSYEVGVRKTGGSLSYAASVFYDDVSNGRLNVAGDSAFLNANDLLWDGTSTTSIYNIGAYRSSGYIASVDESFTPFLHGAVAYGRMSGFTSETAGVSPDSADRHSFLHEGNRSIATATVNTLVPGSRTRVSAIYGWVDGRTAIPSHAFTTQTASIAPGLNICIHQPLPSFPGIPGHFELTADLRNLFAQGYLPISGTGGQTLLIVQSPRALRGGLNFTF